MWSKPLGNQSALSCDSMDCGVRLWHRLPNSTAAHRCPRRVDRLGECSACVAWFCRWPARLVICVGSRVPPGCPPVAPGTSDRRAPRRSTFTGDLAAVGVAVRGHPRRSALEHHWGLRGTTHRPDGCRHLLNEVHVVDALRVIMWARHAARRAATGLAGVLTAFSRHTDM